ncbi:hypothetical protein M0804_014709 [Polistes exclamans]|nr:hypothetical protein M0804_014710 [Polistes exclamans]KAI4474716.1 hypothetical protein M0804_014709 [Polistes exclamans]
MKDRYSVGGGGGTCKGALMVVVVMVGSGGGGSTGTDSGWDNPFRPDGDLSREADEIVELIKGGKPITPTPGQTAPPLPGCEETGKTTPGGGEHDSSSSPLLKSNANSTNRHSNASPRLNQGNGNAHGTPIKSSTAVNSQLGNNEKVNISKIFNINININM